MGFPAQLDHDNLHFPDDDTISHFAFRELQIFLRMAVVLSIVATAVMMATFWFFAWIPFLGLCASILALMFTSGVEQRTRSEHLERAHHEHTVELAHELHPDADNALEAQLLANDEEHFMPMRLLKKESIIGVEIIIGLGLAAVALVVVGLITGHIPLEVATLGIGLFISYGLLVMAPVWLGWMTDVEAVERGHASNERRG